VRWAFIEQTVLLGGAGSGKALGASARVVSGRWLWSASLLAGLGTLALTLTPVLGTLLILAMPQHMSYVNLAGAVVYACLTPYVAIALALAYFSLSSHAQERQQAGRKRGRERPLRSSQDKLRRYLALRQR
jgi:hypothetical protein